jgi:hypothetical protein
MADQTSHDHEVWASALLAVVQLIAAADGKIDAKESKRVHELLDATRSSDLPYLPKAAELALSSFDTRMTQGAGAKPLDSLAQAVSLANRDLHALDAQRFREGLYAFGKALAQASGGGILGVGNRTSAEERAALEQLARVLGVTTA